MNSYGSKGRLIESFYSAVAGVTFENRQTLLSNLCVGQQLVLKRMPDNPYDSNAIAVYDTKSLQQIGYIRKYVAANLAPIMDRRDRCVACTVKEITGGGVQYIGINILIEIFERNAGSVNEDAEHWKISSKDRCKEIGDSYFLRGNYSIAYEAYYTYGRYRLSPLGEVLEGFYQRCGFGGYFSPFEDYEFFPYVIDIIFYMGIAKTMSFDPSCKDRFSSDYNSVVNAIKNGYFDKNYITKLYEKSRSPSLYSICYDTVIEDFQFICDDKIKYDRYGRYPSDGRTFDERTEFDYANLLKLIRA